MEPLSVVVVGGTHGNEFSGIELVKRWRRQPLQREGLSIQTLWSNPKAHQQNRRYLEQDLNRQFELDKLADGEARDYEPLLAKSLNAQIGPKGASKTDLVIDLHNTTSNMGPTLILLESDPWHRRLAGFVKARMPEAVILLEDIKPAQQWGYLCTLGKRGVMVEVGPQPQSVLRPEILEQMATLTELVLDYASLAHLGDLPELPAEVEAFRYRDTLRLPLDQQGQPLGMVHANIDGKDFTELKPGQPVYQLFSGEEVLFDGTESGYPHFINEAAYYNTHNAFSLADKVCLTIPASE
ncbi:aspartoacylase [Ferrimonas marina]|uniref:Aspartoacylase n=1 Tax=Ferrimonas marina TaxID=299255 RepID=A0A1M5R9Y5_9GAMM|nr:aspartoacylase [Ferrimonas marina]SHH22836.1 aspartoacylase [Ferrimonas marina]